MSYGEGRLFDPELITGGAKAIDICVIIGVGMTMFALLGLDGALTSRELDRYFLTSLVAAMLFAWIFEQIGGYEATRLTSVCWQQIRAATVSGGIGLGVLLLAACSGLSDIRPDWATGWLGTTVVMLLVERRCLGFAVAHWARRGGLARNVIIVGAGERGQQVIASICKSKGNAVIRGVFDDRWSRVPREVFGHRVLGTTDALLPFARRTPVDEVIVTVPLEANERIKALVEKLSVLPIAVRLAADPSDQNLRVRGVRQIGDLDLLEVAERPIKAWPAVLKSVIDLFFSSILLLLLAPVMALIALAIKLEDPGPVLFSQKRLGFNNNAINVLKFRTMYVHCCDPGGAQRTVRNDPRVTRVGAILRSLSFDELPQLFNILKGDMSLVGPRPHPIAMMAGQLPYCDAVSAYAHRHRVKPGITGWAQVNGYRGEVDTLEKAWARVQYDLFYIERWSLAFDLKILALTVPAALYCRNAY